MRMLVDFHHSSLLKSLYLLFERRLGITVYRPIGMEWYDEGYWAIYPSEDTAKQFLSLDQAYRPIDGTPELNALAIAEGDQVFYAKDPGGKSLNRGCTLAFFKEFDFDLVLCSVPQHIPLFRKLIEEYNPKAKLIFQVGNNWPIEEMQGMNVLASITERPTPGVNTVFYHQEIDLDIFTPYPCYPTNRVYSFVNVQQNTGQGWHDFLALEKMTEYFGCTWKSLGGQCRDGNATGDQEVADMMRSAMLVYHVKPGGDGFGHVLHNAYAVGRPIITRRSHYDNQLGQQLMVPETIIDLDQYSLPEAKNLIHRLYSCPEELIKMGESARKRFEEVVNYDKETEDIRLWLERLI